MLKVKKLYQDAKVPTCAHQGFDLGYDIYAYQDDVIPKGMTCPVSTGIAIQFASDWGGILKDRSSMASFGLSVVGGVIDRGYTGEVLVLIFNHSDRDYKISKGDKIAQLIPSPVKTYGGVEEVEELEQFDRGSKGFGSTGR